MQVLSFVLTFYLHQSWFLCFCCSSTHNKVVCYIIKWLCLTRTGNYQIHELDWLKSILNAVWIFPSRLASRPILFYLSCFIYLFGCLLVWPSELDQSVLGESWPRLLVQTSLRLVCTGDLSQDTTIQTSHSVDKN